VASSSNTGLPAGLGTGLGFAAMIAATLIFFLVHSRRRRGQAGDVTKTSPYTNEMPDHEHDQMLFVRIESEYSELPVSPEHTGIDMEGRALMDTGDRSDGRSGGMWEGREELGG
jgi:hypothetical protein